MIKVNKSEITWTTIDNNLRVGIIKGKGVIIENENRRILLDKKRAKKLKFKMLDVFKEGTLGSGEID